MILVMITLWALLSWSAAGLWLGQPLWVRPRRTVNSATALSNWMQEWQLGAGVGRPLNELGEVPSFKFFGELARRGLAHARAFGSFPREILWEWREGIGKEAAFDKKWRGVVWGGWAQFTLFAAITWTFIVMTQQTLARAFPSSLLLAVASWQALGAGAFGPCLWALQRRRLAGFAELMECLYVLRSLGGAGLPSQQVLREARLEDLARLRNPRLRLLRDRVLALTQLHQQQGVPLIKECQLLLQEAWFAREEALMGLTKASEAVKLVFLLVFFGGAYMLFLLGLVQQLLSEG